MVITNYYYRIIVIIIITPMCTAAMRMMFCASLKLNFITVLTDEAITSKKLLTEQPKDLDIAVRYR